MSEKKKKKFDKAKFFTRIIAGMMALFMVLGICYTLIFYIQLMFE